MANDPKPEEGLSWGKSTVETACPLDCPDNCSLSVSVERGKIVKIDGNTNHSLTEGYICGKVRRFADRVYGDDRLLHPAVRKGPKGTGQLTRVSWDEALELIASKMREIKARAGGEAILPLCYGGSNGLLTQDTTDEELFRRLGASRLDRTVCAAPTRAAHDALYGRMPGVAFQDYPASKLIVIWGANPSSSSIHLVSLVREAQRNGAKLVVLDPRRTQLGKHADLFLPIHPGTDLVVALALHRYLFENGLADEQFLADHTTGADRLREKAAPWTIERAAAVAGLEPEQLASFAEMYAATSPALIRCGWGLERNRNGGHAAMAILALPAVAGKFGVRGGGFSMTTSSAWKPYMPVTWIDGEEQQTRIINMNQIGRILTEPQTPAVELLFVYNCNPVATLPDQNRVIRGLQREDLFTVVFDQVRTDTAVYADVVLPATTFLESYDLARSYGSYALQMVKPAIEPVGESRSNMEVFSDLAARLGLLPARTTEPENDVDTLLRVLGHIPEDIRDALTTKGIAVPPTGPVPVQFVDVFPRTPDQKVRLHPDVPTQAPGGLYSYQGDPATDKYPLALISPASEKTISSMLGELRKRTALLYMHEDDAAARGISDEEVVRVFNDQGEIHCLVRLGKEIARGTISLPKGLWRRSTMNRSTSNALAPDTLTDMGGGACFNDARVEVARMIDATFDGKNLAFYVPSSPGKPGTVH